MKVTKYWIRKIKEDGKTLYQITDNVWYSTSYTTLAQAREILQQVLWGNKNSI
jgi:hypothetical protein